MKVFAVIPAFNEAKNLPSVINGLQGKVDEIVVVDDCSTDDTVKQIANLPVQLIKHLINRGQGAALKTGTVYALKQGADIIVHFDADGQFLADDISKLTRPIIANQAAIVFGSRFLDQTTIMPWFKKYVIMKIARFINRIFFNIKLTDPQSGFRAFGRQAAEKIDWQQDRMAHCSEILVASYASGLPIKEVPITVLYKDFGQRFSGGFKILRDLFIAKLNN